MTPKLRIFTGRARHRHTVQRRDGDYRHPTGRTAGRAEISAQALFRAHHGCGRRAGDHTVHDAGGKRRSKKRRTEGD